MDDDQNRTLDFNEFKKGMRDYGLHPEPKVILLLCSQYMQLYNVILKSLLLANSFTLPILVTQVYWYQ